MRRSTTLCAKGRGERGGCGYEGARTGFPRGAVFCRGADTHSGRGSVNPGPGWSRIQPDGSAHTRQGSTGRPYEVPGAHAVAYHILRPAAQPSLPLGHKRRRRSAYGERRRGSTGDGPPDGRRQG